MSRPSHHRRRSRWPSGVVLVYRRVAIGLILLAVIASSWLAVTTVSSYVQAMQAFRVLRFEIDPSSERLVGTRVELVVTVANGSPTRDIVVERLELGFYLRGRFVASEMIVRTSERIPASGSRKYVISLPLRPEVRELLRDGGRRPRWSGEGLAVLRLEGMRRPVQLRVVAH